MADIFSLFQKLPAELQCLALSFPISVKDLIALQESSAYLYNLARDCVEEIGLSEEEEIPDYTILEFTNLKQVNARIVVTSFEKLGLLAEFIGENPVTIDLFRLIEKEKERRDEEGEESRSALFLYCIGYFLSKLPKPKGCQEDCNNSCFPYEITFLWRDPLLPLEYQETLYLSGDSLKINIDEMTSSLDFMYHTKDYPIQKYLPKSIKHYEGGGYFLIEYFAVNSCLEEVVSEDISYLVDRPEKFAAFLKNNNLIRRFTIPQRESGDINWIYQYISDDTSNLLSAIANISYPRVQAFLPVDYLNIRQALQVFPNLEEIEIVVELATNGKGEYLQRDLDDLRLVYHIPKISICITLEIHENLVTLTTRRLLPLKEVLPQDLPERVEVAILYFD